MKQVGARALKHLVDKFSGQRIMVIGDVMLDEYIWGKVSRISPEAPIPVVHVQKENALPGGAANVANNIIALGGKVFLAGLLGKDANAAKIKRLLKAEGVDTGLLLTDQNRPTITKTRVIAHSQHVVRIDREIHRPISEKMEERLIGAILERMAEMDAVILSDYNKGLLTPKLMSSVIGHARKRNLIITGDPKPENIMLFSGATLISPNQSEAERSVHIKIDNEKKLLAAGQKLLEMLGSEAILITRGEEGMSLFERGGKVSHVPTVAREVFDVSGAGDTVISTLTLALAGGGSFQEAAVAANCAAGITVAEIGVATTTQTELKARIEEEPWK
jgi:D-beta-D-heptose 7-phosphate kinase/D-beta-D-heptose 1-phosphate adenosyltransferase